jgi:hypothetical protein
LGPKLVATAGVLTIVGANAEDALEALARLATYLGEGLESAVAGIPFFIVKPPEQQRCPPSCSLYTGG